MARPLFLTAGFGTALIIPAASNDRRCCCNTPEPMFRSSFQIPTGSNGRFALQRIDRPPFLSAASAREAARTPRHLRRARRRTTARSTSLGILEQPTQKTRPPSGALIRFFTGIPATPKQSELHLSVLSAGHSPHPPHAHVEEELLLVLDGVGEILITEDDKSEGRVEALHPGSFVYYPAYQHHTIRNRAHGPVTYVMFKWQSRPLEVELPMPTRVFHMDDAFEDAGSDPMGTWVVFELPTSYLTKLHAHETVLQPGTGYPAHADEHDVAIIMKSGKVRTAGKDIGPRGIVFFPAGEPHGMHNPGPAPAYYLVFEFHGQSGHDVLTPPLRRWFPARMRKLASTAKNRLAAPKDFIVQFLKRSSLLVRAVRKFRAFLATRHQR